MLRHVRRFSYAPPKGAGGSDNSSFFGLLGIASVIGYAHACMLACLPHAMLPCLSDANIGMDMPMTNLLAINSGAAYVYYDPDVLPEGVKRFLPIQEPQGHGMSLEEYEKWRAQQAGLPTTAVEKKIENIVDAAEEAAKAAEEVLKKSEGALVLQWHSLNRTTERRTNALLVLWRMYRLAALVVLRAEEFLGKSRTIATESKASLEKLLAEARENEAGYLAELKKTKAPLTDEDRMLVRSCATSCCCTCSYERLTHSLCQSLASAEGVQRREGASEEADQAPGCEEVAA